jgi:protoporphyrinogen/coproporphyrinogen III oxidase
MNTQPPFTAPDRTQEAPSEPGAHVVIIGGGVAGLSAAWYVQREVARRSLPLRYSVLEAADRWGGKVRSERVEDLGDTSTVVEAGPDAFLTRKPWALDLARELGLEDHLLFIRPQNLRTYTLRRGRLAPLPDGWSLLAPTRWKPFFTSPVFSFRGKARICLEPVIPPRHGDEDESLAQFVRRRLGAEALDRVAEPLMAGVFNAPAGEQSLRATFPQFAALERDYGSVIRGLRATSRERDTKTVAPFVSFDAGTELLVERLVARLDGDLQLRSEVVSVAPGAGGAFDVLLRDGGRLRADAVVVATPAPSAARIMRFAAPDVAHLLMGIGFTGIGSLYLGYRRHDIPHTLDGAGVVIPSSEGRRIDGMTWVSSKWPTRAPRDVALLRVFFGGPATRAALELDDAALIAVVRAELSIILGTQAPPLFHRVFRWREGYPQYTVGHLDRVEAIEGALPAGVYVAGSSFHGVGVPDCVRQGQEAARRVIAALAPLTDASAQRKIDPQGGRPA